jgi:hypothetical protein
MWLHDASVLAVVRKGGPHEAKPDLSYAPQRARVVSERPVQFSLVLSLQAEREAVAA